LPFTGSFVAAQALEPEHVHISALVDLIQLLRRHCLNAEMRAGEAKKGRLRLRVGSSIGD
jgi:hypothetical protein